MSTEKTVKVTPPARPFGPAARATLDTLMTLMIPASRDGLMPAAAALGLFDDSSTLAPGVRATLDEGLTAIDERARQMHDKAFAELPMADAMAIVEWARQDRRSFMSAFTLHTTARYLAHDEVMTALGLEARPNWPRGHDVPDGDWSLLDPVRQRPPIWRPVE